MKLIRKYIVLALALLITISATGVSISLHKCCGSIKDFSFFGDAKECKMAKRPLSSTCPNKSDNSIAKTSCCSNHQISLNEGAQKLPVAKSEVKQKDQNFNVLFVYTLFKTWGQSFDKEKESDGPSPGLFFTEALILLLQQFRI